jgi:hypothetical protein
MEEESLKRKGTCNCFSIAFFRFIKADFYSRGNEMITLFNNFPLSG